VPESINHVALVSRLLTYVQNTMNGNLHLHVLHDLPGPIGSERPPLISGFRPDLYATDMTRQTVLVGEAKTTLDLETEHSRAQYTAYVRHLSIFSAPTLILAVPWHLRVRAKTLLRLAAEEANAIHVARIVVDDMEGL
jgi:hypothetical protein